MKLFYYKTETTRKSFRVTLRDHSEHCPLQYLDWESIGSAMERENEVSWQWSSPRAYWFLVFRPLHELTARLKDRSTLAFASPCQTIATFERNLSQNCWAQHVACCANANNIRILAVCRTPITQNSVKWPCSPWAIVAQSLDRAPAWCSEHHEFNSCRESDFYFASRSCDVDQLTFDISWPSLKFTIFIRLPHSRSLRQCWS